MILLVLAFKMLSSAVSQLPAAPGISFDFELHYFIRVLNRKRVALAVGHLLLEHFTVDSESGNDQEIFQVNRNCSTISRAILHKNGQLDKKVIPARTQSRAKSQ